MKRLQVSSPLLRGRGQGEGGVGGTSADLQQAPPPPTPPRKGEGGAIHTSTRSDAMAKRLRRTPTFTETLLWSELRKLRVLNGLHFRRQAPLGPYVVDFVCHCAKLVVEADGGVHVLTAERDVTRDAWLIARGYRVLRISNGEIAQNIDAVVRRIITACTAGAPTPDPSPQGRGAWMPQ